MKHLRHDLQTSQRLRVGLVGLVAVVALIWIASWIISSTAGDVPANTATETAVNLADGNVSAEPLAELGATPGTLNDQVATTR